MRPIDADALNAAIEAWFDGVCVYDVSPSEAVYDFQSIVDEQPTISPDEVRGVPKWISVEERLPEQGERVLVSNGGFICESYLSQSGKWQRGGVDMFFMTPTHWMPLPEPPKEVE